MKDRSVTFTRAARRPAPRTIRTLQYLASSKDPQSPQKIALFVKAPYNSVIKTLGRLVKKGLAKKVSRGLYSYNHDDPMLLPTYSGDVSLLSLHRIGLYALTPNLRDHVVAAGRCMLFEWKRGIGSRPRSLVFNADMRLFDDSAYFQEGCEPFPTRNLMLRYEDFIRSLDYYTKGLADYEGVYLRDYEFGKDVPFDMFFWDMLGISRIIIYRKKGMLRIHVQCSKRSLRLPLDEDTKLRIDTDFITMLDEARMLIDKLLQAPTLYDARTKTGH